MSIHSEQSSSSVTSTAPIPAYVSVNGTAHYGKPTYEFIIDLTDDEDESEYNSDSDSDCDSECGSTSDASPDASSDASSAYFDAVESASGASSDASCAYFDTVEVVSTAEDDAVEMVSTTEERQTQAPPSTQHAISPLEALLAPLRTALARVYTPRRKSDEEHAIAVVNASAMDEPVVNYLYSNPVTLAEVQLLVPEFKRRVPVGRQLATNIGWFYSQGRISIEDKDAMVQHILLQGAWIEKSPNRRHKVAVPKWNHKLFDDVTEKVTRFQRKAVANEERKAGKESGKRFPEEGAFYKPAQDNKSTCKDNMLTPEQQHDIDARIAEYPAHLQQPFTSDLTRIVGAASIADFYSNECNMSWADVQAYQARPNAAQTKPKSTIPSIPTALKSDEKHAPPPTPKTVVRLPPPKTLPPPAKETNPCLVAPREESPAHRTKRLKRESSWHKTAGSVAHLLDRKQTDAIVVKLPGMSEATTYAPVQVPYSKTCYKRGGTGHTSRHCVPGNKCPRCGEVGHSSAKCPNATEFPAQGSFAKRCYKCGEPGHLSGKCLNEAKCYKCGKSGHIASNCPDNDGKGNEKKCYKCGEPGHISLYCPNGGKKWC